MVIVPVLSNNKVIDIPLLSPQPYHFLQLHWPAGVSSIQAIPIADSRPPMVVGIGHTNSDI